MVCNRGSNSFPHVIRLTANPGGVSHAEHKRLFIDKRYKESEKPEYYDFIKALVTDNKALMQSDENYIRTL